MRKFSSVRSNIFYRKMLKKCKALLCNGLYKMSPNMRTFVHFNSAEVLSKFPHDYPNGLQQKILGFFPVLIISRHKSFNGSAVYFSNMNDVKKMDIKIFDFSAKLITTICPNKPRFDDVIQRKQLASQYYPMPNFEVIDQQKFSYQEQYINDNKQMVNVSIVIDKLISFYLDLYSKIDRSQSLICALQFEQVPSCLHHGDLSVDNFVFDESTDKIYFIDFDHIGTYPFFYDLFYMAVNSYVALDDSSYLDCLLYNNNLRRIQSFLCEYGSYTVSQAFGWYRKFFFENRLKENTSTTVQKYERIFSVVERRLEKTDEFSICI